ncbi:alpha pinene synthase, chloroplastic isoform X1 [Cryptomeria japonica]|uniref:alpha pinene synthase, chloroplastic isoform X1 n=1 Tax=Cryptomeria japonica TaxID=3369 RepID=UPI0027D9D1BC|nr:alpha pinene synthase, chloroplastic isoform X1 [Cryptomeria japonica]
MASISLSPSALGFSGLNKASNQLKLFAKPSRRRLDLLPCKASSTPQTTARRTANHHPNLWDDNFIQSLPKAYEAPCYAEEAETFIREVKEMFNGMPTQNSSVHERLSMVDKVERLGIDRHFQKEIKEALDCVYRYWNDKGIGNGESGSCADLNTTVLALRILRLHRYDVSSGVLENFKEKDGNFLNSYSQSNEEINTILNLYRVSLIAFPEEKIMEEAKVFATKYLKEVMSQTKDSNISKEIQFNLEYGWHTNMPRFETRNYIDIYGGNTSWMACKSNKKILYLAKLDFNMVQSLQQQELQLLSRWWTESGVPQLDFARNRYVEYYFWAAGGCVEPKYYAYRIGCAKIASIATVLDDIYDTYGTLDELKLFTNAVKRWDPSSIDYLPEYMKVVFMAFYEIVNEMVEEATKTQGRDTLDYARKVWEAFLDSYMQEAEWLATSYIPTFEEYLENAKISGGARIVILQPLLTLDAVLPDTLLPKIDFPSRFNELLALTFRLSNDINSFKAEVARGEKASCVACYMRDRSTEEEEALDHLKSLNEKLFKELSFEYLKLDSVPMCSKDHAISLSQGYHFFYRERDGFTISTKDTRNYILKILVQPMTILMNASKKCGPMECHESIIDTEWIS